MCRHPGRWQYALLLAKKDDHLEQERESPDAAGVHLAVAATRVVLVPFDTSGALCRMGMT